ncbi:hypothetical protein Syun_006650 [Stephania yunnanensis]|uniref:Endonuclease/exonuclease/phosphatase domain-containing protein n=1 Tax=Stephania yunnanensis TaxID=152371 RepID=A0AAP0KYP2_9MAGN
MDSQSPSLLAWCLFTSSLSVPGLLALPVAVTELARLAGRGGSGPGERSQLMVKTTSLTLAENKRCHQGVSVDDGLSEDICVSTKRGRRVEDNDVGKMNHNRKCERSSVRSFAAAAATDSDVFTSLEIAKSFDFTSEERIYNWLLGSKILCVGDWNAPRRAHKHKGHIPHSQIHFLVDHTTISTDPHRGYDTIPITNA